jgi:hypothetical protein
MVLLQGRHCLQFVFTHVKSSQVIHHTNIEPMCNISWHCASILFWLGNLKERDQETTGQPERNRMGGDGLDSCGAGRNGGLPWSWEWTFCFHRLWGILWLADKLLACEEGLCSMELFDWLVGWLVGWLVDWAIHQLVSQSLSSGCHYSEVFDSSPSSEMVFHRRHCESFRSCIFHMRLSKLHFVFTPFVSYKF